MKKNWLLLICILTTVVSFAQQGNFVTKEEYRNRKVNGTLQGDEIVLTDAMVNPNSVPNASHYVHHFSHEKATGCSGYFDPPGAPLNISWGTDDGSTPQINLPFTFCFFGDNYTSVWMNNNGNISFTGAIGTFSASAFPSLNNEMIAAFWADFDFTSCGTMHYTITPTAAIFNWVDAGYFNDMCDKKNTCQIVITNGSDPLINGGNVAIHYDDMNWTTGSASNGTNGFGGTPATMGANRGNNIDYFQLGRFDHAGTDYDGPGGVTDGVDFLDHKSYFFDFCAVTGGNVAPIPINSNTCDTLGVCHLGDTLDIAFPFIAPENNQVTTVSYSAPTLSNVQVVSNTSGYTGTLTLRIIGALETIGYHDITVTGTDNGTIPGVTSVTYTIEVTDPATAFPVTPLVTYVQGCAPVTFDISNSTFDGFVWSNGSTDSTTVISAAFNDTLKVWVSNGGCIMEIDTLVNIPFDPPLFEIDDNFYACPNSGADHIEIGDSSIMASMTWSQGATVVSNNFSADLGVGTYTAHLVGNTGCINDTTFTITTQIPITLSYPTAPLLCLYTLTDTLKMTTNTGVEPGHWTFATSIIGGTATFEHADSLNTNVLFSQYGTYQLIYTEPTCNDDDTLLLNVTPGVGISQWVSNHDLCEGFTLEIGETPDLSQYVTSYVWSTGETTPTITVSQEGSYTLSLQNACEGPKPYTTFVDVKVCDIEMPNVFTPNGDGDNDLYKIITEDDGIFKSFHIVITNRWGNLIKEYDDINGTWDGTNGSGKFESDGVYFYSVEAVTIEDVPLKKQGFIQIISQ